MPIPLKRLWEPIRYAIWHALQDDTLNTAKSAAYSAMLMLFPALIILTSILALVPVGTTLLGEIRVELEQVVPSETMTLVRGYLLAGTGHSVQVILSASSLSFFGSLGLTMTVMEGFRRAYRQPRAAWGFWNRRLRAMLLIPIVLLPLSLANLVILLGRSIELWMIVNSRHELKPVVILVWRLARWAIAVVTTVAVVGALYHFGTSKREHWVRVLPGAVASTGMWFVATMAYGWYVPRAAHYGMVYGSLGAVVATLIWLYISTFSVLFGAELNGALFRQRRMRATQRDRI